MAMVDYSNARPTVTVIVPTYNRSDMIAEALDSILAQSRPVDEIIIINDGSTDNTLHALEAYGSRIRIITKPNGGKSSALNRGLQASTGSLIWIFDDDDIALPNALETLLARLKTHPEADFAYGRHDRFSTTPDGEVQLIGTGYWQECAAEDFLWETMLDFFVHQGGMLVKRELYELAGPFDVSMKRSQDYEMLLRLATHGRAVATNDVVFLQRQHTGQRGPTSMSFDSVKSIRMWRKFDREIFSRVYRDMPLDNFMPADSHMSVSMRLRHALIRRSTVMARKGLWKLAYYDLHAAGLISKGDLTSEEISDLRQCFSSKYVSHSVLKDDSTRVNLIALCGLSQAGAQICSALSRGLVWRIRKTALRGKICTSLLYLNFVVTLSLSSWTVRFPRVALWQEKSRIS